MMTIVMLRDDARAKTESSRKVTGALLKYALETCD